VKGFMANNTKVSINSVHRIGNTGSRYVDI